MPRVRLGVALALTLPLLSATAAHATITVANTNDSGPGSLRAAIAEAPSGETIVVPAGEYTLSSGELTVAKNLTISGAGAATTVITAAGSSRVLAVNLGSTKATISGVTIRDGKITEAGESIEGAGVLVSSAALTLQRVVITDNHLIADGEFGFGGGVADGAGIGAIGGTVTLEETEVTENSASAEGGSLGGGGVIEGGAVSIRGGTLVMSNSTVRGNIARVPGGEGSNGGVVEGGGVYVIGSSTITGSTIAENNAEAQGGQGPSSTGQKGGVVEGGGADVIATFGSGSGVSATTVNGNVADASGGPGGKGGVVEGGGLDAGTASVPLALTNLTITANTARALGGGVAEGGGLDAFGGSGHLTITNSTINANTAEAPGAAFGGNLAAFLKTQIRNSIVSAGSADAGEENCDSEEAPVSLGGNLDSADQCGFHAAGDHVNTNPLLGGLAAHGGPVQTEAITAASPAFDAGLNTGCPAADARGAGRPAGAACDIGAFELAVPNATTGTTASVSQTGATLQGSASNPALTFAKAFFEYGTSTSYGTTTSVQSLGPGVNGQALTASIGGLSPATTYHVRLVAINGEGSSAGGDQTFTTSAVTSRPVPPALSGLAISPTKVRPFSGKGASIAPSRKKQRGATVAYRDTQAGTATFTVLEQARGFKSGHSCRAKRPRHGKGKARRCTYFKKIGAFARKDAAGANSFVFSGRVGGRPLGRGRYKLVAVSRNANGSSAPAKAAFKIV